MTWAEQAGNRKTAIALLAASVVLTLSAPAARADVIEISPTGEITTIAGPTRIIGAERTALAPPKERAAAATPAADVLPLSTEISQWIDSAARRAGISPALVHAVAWQESRYRSRAVSRRGAIGIMQLMPGTARQLGVDPWDPQQNIEGGAAYLAAMLAQFKGDTRLALAAYNAGPEAVRRHNGVPPFRETQFYVKSITSRLQAGR